VRGTSSFIHSLGLLPQAAPVAEKLAISTPLKIGIQVRFGDSEMAKPQAAALEASALEAALARAQGWFKCAEDIEAQISNGTDRPVVWYLISDSLALRKAAQTSMVRKL